MHYSFDTQKIVMSHVNIQLGCIFSVTCFNFIYEYKITNNITRFLYSGYLGIISSTPIYQHFSLIKVFNGTVKRAELSFQGYFPDIRKSPSFKKLRI